MAGRVDACLLALRGELSRARALGQYELPAVLGNVVGGVLLVALLNHRQVAGQRAQG